MKPSVMICVTFWTIFSASAFSPAKAEADLKVYLDDDLLGMKSTDADYTGGLALTWAKDLSDEASGKLDSRLSGMERMLGFRPSSYRYELEFGVAAFTPADIGSAELITDDRPYAGLMYVSGALNMVEDGPRSSVTALTLGVLGSDLVPKAQCGVHRAIGSDLPQGWRHQISDGGEATLRLMHERKWMSEPASFAKGRAQWFYRASFGLGFLTDVSAGVGARFGQFSSNRWDIHSAPTGLGDRAIFNSTSHGDRFFYGSFAARAPFYNAMLQGQWRDSDFTVPSRDLRRVVPDATVGFVLGLQKNCMMQYSLRALLSEMRLRERSDTIHYGGVSLSC